MGMHRPVISPCDTKGTFMFTWSCSQLLTMFQQWSEMTGQKGFLRSFNVLDVASDGQIAPFSQPTLLSIWKRNTVGLCPQE